MDFLDTFRSSKSPEGKRQSDLEDEALDADIEVVRNMSEEELLSDFEAMLVCFLFLGVCLYDLCMWLFKCDD
jgi:hypothetical protein